MSYDQRHAERWMLLALALGRPIGRRELASYLRVADEPIPEALRAYLADVVAKVRRTGRKGSGKRSMTEAEAWLRDFVYRHMDTYFEEAGGISKLAFARMLQDLKDISGLDSLTDARLRDIWSEAPSHVKEQHKARVRELAVERQAVRRLRTQSSR